MNARGPEVSRTMLRIVEAPLNQVTRVFLVGGMIAMFLMAVHVTVDVIGRLTDDHPVYGTTEVVSFYRMAAAVCLPLAYIMLCDEHITTELFYSHLLP